MNTFPTLRTGAVMQYPASKDIQFSAQVVRFIDGSEQRFREFAQPLSRWSIQLDKLDEHELNGLREFFRIVSGGAEAFVFTDPWDGVQYASCSLETDEMIETLLDEGRGNTTLVVKENRT